MSDRVPGGEDMLRRWPAGGREGAVARLMALDSRGELATEHARAVAGSLGVSLRTVWNWVAAARREGRLSARTPSRAGVTPDVRVRLAVGWERVSGPPRAARGSGRDRFPGPEPFRQIPPLHTRSHPVEDTVDHSTVITPPAPTRTTRR